MTIQKKENSGHILRGRTLILIPLKKDASYHSWSDTRVDLSWCMKSQPVNKENKARGRRLGGAPSRIKSEAPGNQASQPLG